MVEVSCGGPLIFLDPSVYILRWFGNLVSMVLIDSALSCSGELPFLVMWFSRSRKISLSRGSHGGILAYFMKAWIGFSGRPQSWIVSSIFIVNGFLTFVFQPHSGFMLFPWWI